MKVTATVTIPSIRVYKDELSSSEWDMILLTFIRYNRLKEWYYNQSYNEKYLGIPFVHGKETETSLLKQRYKELYGSVLSDYYISSLFSTVNGMRKSQRELMKLAAIEQKERQENRQEKVDVLSEKLARMKEGKVWLKAYGKFLAGKGVEPDAPSVQKHGFTFSGGKIFFRGKKNRIQEEDPLTYERSLEKRIKHTKARIALIKDKIRRTEEAASDTPSRITFGSKKQYRKKDTLALTGKRLDDWHEERDFARYRIVNFSGRASSKDGNFLCKYHAEDHTMEVTMINGRKVLFHDVYFPYRGEELEAYLCKRKGSVGYTMERKIDASGREYLIFKATFTESKRDLNYSKSDGVLAYDFNYDHIAWADVGADGNLIKSGVIPFHLDGLSSGHAKVVLGTAVKNLVSLAVKRQKPIVREHVAILTVNPAYTSLIAKVKYMQPKGISIHCAAAYVIGRRALGVTEQVPQYLKKVSARAKNPWRSIFSHAKKATSSYFRKKQPVWDKWKLFDADVRKYKEDYSAWKQSPALTS